MRRYAVRLERDVLRVTGGDAETFLQGQLSQDVAAMQPGDWSWSLLLQPQGKVAAWLRVHRTGAESFDLDVDAGWGEQVQARLERFKLRSDVTIEPLDWVMVGLRGPGIETVGAPVWRMDGVDLLGPDPDVPAGFEVLSVEEYEPLRIEAGVPAMGAELTDDTIPEAAGVVADSASFTKGCYVGQELVARIDSRGGNVPTRLRRLVVRGGDIAVGEALVVDGAEVGTVTSAAWHPGHGHTVALAYVKRAVEPPAVGEVAGVPADVLA